MDKKHKQLQKEHELEQHEVKQVLDFLKQYGVLIGIGVVTATAVVLVSYNMRVQKMRKNAEAEIALVNAKTPDQIEEVISKYKSTPTAQAAILQLAETHFNNGDYTAARTEYDRFIRDYKNNASLPLAEFGLAYCTDADGKFAAAAEEFKAFTRKHAGHYLEPLAILSEARCLNQAGKPDEARIVLEDFLANNADSPWTGTAKKQLEALKDNSEPAETAAKTPAT